MTTPFDFKTHKYVIYDSYYDSSILLKKPYIIYLFILRTLVPKWDEIIVFNESFEHFTKDHPNVLIIFEVTK